MKEKKIRIDIIKASISSYGIDHMNKIYKKASTLNNLIVKEVGEDIVTSYKRASSILENELKIAKLNYQIQLTLVFSKMIMRKIY